MIVNYGIHCFTCRFAWKGKRLTIEHSKRLRMEQCTNSACRSDFGATWRRYQTETFSTLRAICAGNSPVPAEFPTQRPVTQSFYVFFDLHPNKRLSKQWWGWWFETPSCPLWRHCNAYKCNITPVDFAWTSYCARFSPSTNLETTLNLL